MTGLASLPMYAVPANGLAEFWRGLRGHMTREGLAGVPEGLEKPADLLGHWLDPELLLSQTCGYPLTTTLSGRVQYVGTPRYNATGCDGSSYSSILVVRADDPAQTLADLAGRRVAFNGHDSQSGMNALRALAAPLADHGRFFSDVIETGAHRASAAAVRDGQADLAAIDAVTFALLSRDSPDVIAKLRSLGFTAQSPGLPLITSLATRSVDVMRLRAAWSNACADPALSESRAASLIAGFDVLPPSAYDVIPAMRALATAAGYPTLA